MAFNKICLLTTAAVAAFGCSSMAEAQCATALNGAVSCNANAIATGANSTATGNLATATGTSSSAYGDSSFASGNFSTALGDYAAAQGFQSTAVGDVASALAPNASAYGENANVSAAATNGTALGQSSSVTAANGTQLFGGIAVTPPMKGIVMPFGVWPGQPWLSGPAFGAGFMSPPAANTKSSPPEVPGERLASALERSMCPSMPSIVGTHVVGSDV